MMHGGSKIGDSEDDDGSGVRRDKVYKDNSEELILASLSDLYSKLEAISISRPSSYPTLYCLLTTYITNYCSKKDVNNFDLRKSFYSKQYLKNIYYPLV